MTFWRTYYHLVWATHNRNPFITPTIESELYSYVESKIRSFDCPFHAIGGIENHIHLIAWQNEYGVFSLGGKQLETAIVYVHNQKEHHQERLGAKHR
jgi:putative transposase